MSIAVPERGRPADAALPGENTGRIETHEKLNYTLAVMTIFITIRLFPKKQWS
jgi:hypothetical protein